jgi:hypothetical protein
VTGDDYWAGGGCMQGNRFDSGHMAVRPGRGAGLFAPKGMYFRIGTGENPVSLVDACG